MRANVSDARAAVALAVLAVAVFLLLGGQRGSWSSYGGDAGTFTAMAESLALDRDLVFDGRDRQRLETAGDAGRGTVILEHTARGIAYSKPPAYALLGAPFVRLWGPAGLQVLNALALATALWLGWAYLSRLDGSTASLTLATFAATGVLAAYLPWKTSDLVQACLALGGLALCLAAVRAPAGRPSRLLDGGASSWLGGALLGTLVAMRYPNALVAAAAVAALWLAGQRRRAAQVAVSALVVFALLAGVAAGLTGAANPYRAARTTFTPETGYPDLGREASLERFMSAPATQSMGLVPRLEPRRTLYSALYFLIGRHTGLLLYFPAALLLGGSALRRGDRASRVLLLAAGASCVFYLVWWPENYFGGSTFVGNRYFLSAYPCLLVALHRLPGRRWLLACWVVAAVAAGSALASVTRVQPIPAAAASQSHAWAGAFRLLPFESTARAIDGRRDRYWAGDLVAFVDPFAQPRREDFRLVSGAPPAELMVVTADPASRLLLHVRSPAAEARLEIEDWRSRRSVPLAAHGETIHQVVELAPAPAWRRHGFWWLPGRTYGARTVRLSLRGAGREPVTATLAYGGEAGLVERAFVPRFEAGELPRVAPAGSSTTLRLRVRNMSPVPWRSAGALPVVATYRLAPADGGQAPVEGERLALPRDVPSGDPVELSLAVDWPAAPGRYRVVVDLLIEDYSWFAERAGKPLLEGVVEVAAAGGADPEEDA